MDDPDRALLIEAVRDAGALAMSYFTRDYDIWDKPDQTPVSDADIAVNDLLRTRLMGARPDYGWLSEESGDDRSRVGRPRVWVVDPIDGTRAFVRRRPQFAVCVALLEDDRPTIAAIFNPASGEFFEALDGGGARLNGAPMTVSDCRALEGCRMLGPRDMFEHPAWPTPWPAMDLDNPNSIAYRLALVAAGTWDGAMSLSWKSDWDLAAADLIVRESGGRISAHDGTPFRFNQPQPRHRSVIAAGPVLYDAIFARVGHIRLP